MKFNELPGANSVHGYRIIAQFQTAADSVTRAGRVILVDKGIGGHSRYVVAWQGMNKFSRQWDVEWARGDYFQKLSDAALAYEERVKDWGGEV